MTATTAILSLVIIVLCGSLIYMYFFGTAKIKPSDIVDLVDYKKKLSQLSTRVDMIDKKEQFECSSFGNYPSDKVLINRLEKENIVLNERIESLQKELDFVQDTGNRKEGESVGAHYSKIDLSLEPSEESRKKFMERIKPQAPEDRLVNQAKKPIPPNSQIINEIKGKKPTGKTMPNRPKPRNN